MPWVKDNTTFSGERVAAKCLVGTITGATWDLTYFVVPDTITPHSFQLWTTDHNGRRWHVNCFGPYSWTKTQEVAGQHARKRGLTLPLLPDTYGEFLRGE